MSYSDIIYHRNLFKKRLTELNIFDENKLDDILQPYNTYSAFGVLYHNEFDLHSDVNLKTIKINDEEINISISDYLINEITKIYEEKYQRWDNFKSEIILKLHEDI